MHWEHNNITLNRNVANAIPLSPDSWLRTLAQVNILNTPLPWKRKKNIFNRAAIFAPAIDGNLLNDSVYTRTGVFMDISILVAGHSYVLIRSYIRFLFAVFTSSLVHAITFIAFVVSRSNELSVEIDIMMSYAQPSGSEYFQTRVGEA